MKYIFSLILMIILFSGCTSFNLTSQLSMSKDKKEELISQANSGDINAMLKLNKTYLFPQTKEGLKYYTNWTNVVLNSDNYEDIMAFTTIYKEHMNMFVNGKENYIKLLEKAASFGNKEPLYILLDDSLRNARDYKDLEKKILVDASQDDIIKLYDVYNARYKTKEAYRIRDLMVKKGFKPNLNTKFSIFKSLLKQRNQEKKIKNILDDILASSDNKLILEVANLLKKRRHYEEAISFYEKAVKLNPNDAKSYSTIAWIYKNKRIYEEKFGSKKYQKQINENLKKAALLDDFEGAKELLKNYFYNKKAQAKYENLVKELLSLNEAKRAVAYTYENYDKSKIEQAYKILDELATNRNEKAVIYLATKTNTRKNKTLEKFILKWQEFILSSNNPRLMQDTQKAIHFYKYARFKNLKEFKDKLIKIDLDSQNIHTLRRLYAKYNRKDLEKTIAYSNQAIEAGDVYSTNLLIKKYRKENTDKSINEAIKLYKMLEERGDLTSAQRLADIYYFGINGKTNMKDVLKSAYYMHRAYTSYNKFSAKKLAQIYLCKFCNKNGTKIVDFEKAKYYMNELANNGEARSVFKFAWKLNHGKGVVKDLTKAIEVYEIAGKAEYSESYYAIAWIYYDTFKDYKKTIEYLQKGAELYNSNSITLLGNLYLNGEGVKKDIVKAIEYYEMVPSNKFASYNLGYAYSLMNDYKNAKRYYEISAKKDNKGAIFQLGFIYEKGLGVKKDINKAIRLYKKANTKEALAQIELLKK